ncbi:uncharacterized protein LOC106096145 isoform X2 [Stomoxys calcitrans]|uniref:Uncharacterized protein n=1 Tax=Stomoxys calcitrans TaxID=35570 RepID=A0A1I8P445_STOCA|nr:uncharacterized protein LOC106096145 isoform X2 [Stomoxys calcitrans]
MNDLVYYIAGFLFLFVLLPIICFCCHIRSPRLEKLCRPIHCGPHNRNAWLAAWQCTGNADATDTLDNADEHDRQGNVFTIHDESTRESRYNDIFFIEPNSAEAARIRAQLEKDDKDLPSYEEVMRMTSVTSTTPANTAAMTASNASVNTAETRLSVPPYSEVDPNASSTSLHAVGNATTINSASAATPTTQTQSTPPPPLFAAAVVSSSVTQATLNV